MPFKPPTHWPWSRHWTGSISDHLPTSLLLLWLCLIPHPAELCGLLSSLFWSRVSVPLSTRHHASSSGSSQMVTTTAVRFLELRLWLTWHPLRLHLVLHEGKDEKTPTASFTLPSPQPSLADATLMSSSSRFLSEYVPISYVNTFLWPALTVGILCCSSFLFFF